MPVFSYKLVKMYTRGHDVVLQNSGSQPSTVTTRKCLQDTLALGGKLDLPFLHYLFLLLQIILTKSLNDRQFVEVFESLSDRISFLRR